MHFAKDIIMNIARSDKPAVNNEYRVVENQTEMERSMDGMVHRRGSSTSNYPRYSSENHTIQVQPSS